MQPFSGYHCLRHDYECNQCPPVVLLGSIKSIGTVSTRANYNPIQVAVLTIMLVVVANLANTKLYKKTEILLKTLAHTYTHLRVLGEIYPMNTNMAGFKWFSKDFVFYCFGQK